MFNAPNAASPEAPAVVTRLICVCCGAALVIALSGAPAQADVIVSLGDSYSSGEGAPDKSRQRCRRGACTQGWDKGSEATCHRSRFAWPRRLGVKKGRHLACSGARIKDLSNGRTRRGRDSVGQARQLKRVGRDAEIGTVLMTIGGNDIGFVGKLAVCRLGDCLRDLVKLNEELSTLKTNLIPAYNLVANSSSGDLVVVGYPDIFPASNKTFRNCGWVNDAEKGRLTYLQAALDRTLADAAQAAGVDYISIRDALAGHELCTKHSWVNPIRLIGSSLRGHPNARGQRAIVTRVKTRLRQHHAEELAGRWTGPVVQTPAPRIPYSVDMTLRLGASGTLRGEIRYPELGCGGTLTYVKTGSTGTVSLQEHITFGKCVQNCRVKVTQPTDRMTVGFRELCGTISVRGALAKR